MTPHRWRRQRQERWWRGGKGGGRRREQGATPTWAPYQDEGACRKRVGERGGGEGTAGKKARAGPPLTTTGRGRGPAGATEQGEHAKPGGRGGRVGGKGFTRDGCAARGTAVRLLAKACDVRTRVNHHTAPGLAVLSSRQARALATWAGSGPQPEPQPNQRLAVRQEDRRAPSCQPPVQDPHLGPGTHKKIHKLVRTGWSRSSCPRWRLSTARCAHPLAQEHPDASGRGGGAGAIVLVGDRVKEGKKVSPPKNRLSKGSVYIGKSTLQAS